MKNIFGLTVIFISLSANANRYQEVVYYLEEINQIPLNAPVQTCGQIENQFQERPLYTPQEAIKDINSGHLKYLGRDLFPGSDQNRTCVYKSERAYVLYNNCMSSRKEASATDIEVVSFNGDITRFYILANEGPVSSLTRDEYDVTWRVTSSRSEPPGELSVQELKQYMKDSDPMKKGACFVGKTFESLNMDTKGWCSSKVRSLGDDWNEQAEKFWRSPGEDWYQTKKKLWDTVKNR